MTITTDWQAEVGGVTLGTDDYILTGPITGLGLAPPRTADQERGNSPGDVAGFDVDARRVLTVAVGVNGTDATDGWGLLETLKAAWASSTVDVPFDLRLPGFGSADRRFYGRPRGVDVELALLRLGYIDALCTFEALDPYGYGPEVEVALTGAETALVNSGSAPTDRYTLVLDTGTTPVTVEVINDIEGPALTLTDLSGSGDVVFDGRGRTITDGFGYDLYHHLAAGSGWPVLMPGSNTVELTGATGTLTYRPAYR